jgi:hypothetical protein
MRADTEGGPNRDYPLTWNVFLLMNLREPTQASLGARKALRCLTLLLMSMPLPKGMLAGISVRIQLGTQGGGPGGSSPYLVAEGSPPLCFREADPPPEMATKAAAGAPPEPHLTQEESSVGKANAAASKAIPAKPGNDDAAEADGAQPQSNAPISILPDTVRPQLQAQDFLPFFVIPDSAKSTPAVPVPSEPGKLPPSNATYTEK